jgi:hypothetical protein
MSFQLSKHSLEQIKIRNLNLASINELLENPDKIIAPDKETVISADKTSKIEKHQDQV